MELLPHHGSGTGNSTDSPPYQQEEQPVFPEQRAEQAAVRLLVPVILAVGVFGNLATIFVMLRIRDQQQGSSQRAFLVTLAVSDYLLVQTGMLHWLLFRFFRVDLRLWHVLVCKLYYWLLYTAGMQSAWLVTCVTAQRAVSVTWPHRVRAACTWRRTCVVIAFVTLVPCVVNAYLLVGMRITDDNVCDAETAEYHDVFAVWAWVDMLLASVLPSLCLIVCDVMLCLALFKAASVSVVAVKATSDVGGADRHKRASRRKTASGVTAMCLALSATFLVLTLPVCVQHVWINFMHFDLSPRSQARFRLTSSLFHLLWFLNSAVNFFLYCITGTKFRQEFLSWICCRRGQPPSSSSASVSHAWSVKLTHVSN